MSSCIVMILKGSVINTRRSVCAVCLYFIISKCYTIVNCRQRFTDFERFALMLKSAVRRLFYHREYHSRTFSVMYFHFCGSFANRYPSNALVHKRKRLTNLHQRCAFDWYEGSQISAIIISYINLISNECFKTKTNVNKTCHAPKRLIQYIIIP